MELYYALKGVMMGFIVSAPMGPVAVLCVKRVLEVNLFHGYATGLGACLGDGFYAALAAFGLAFLLHPILQHQSLLRLIGSLFLIGLGIYWFKKKRSVKSTAQSKAVASHLGKAFTSAFFLDLANIFTLIVYIALISSFGFSNADPFQVKAWVLVFGVIVGAAAWWFLFIHFVALFKHKLTDHSLVIMDRITALLVISFGFFILITLIFPIKVFGRTF